MLKSFPRWQYGLLVILLLAGLIYAVPNIYGEDPAIQVTSLQTNNNDISQAINILEETFTAKGIDYKSINAEGKGLLVRFHSTETQLEMQDLIKATLGKNYSVALNLASITPKWLANLGAQPMKLGLDLRGGVRFLIDVDIVSIVNRRLEGDYSDIRGGMRAENIRYRKFTRGTQDYFVITFATKEMLDKAMFFLRYNHANYTTNQSDDLSLEVRMSTSLLNEIKNYTMEQTMTTLRNRINELGVAESIVQRQGAQKIVIELPGIQDTARAKDILGKTATLDFVMVDRETDINKSLSGQLPPGRKILHERHGRPVVVHKKIILTGDSITGASSGFDNRDGNPAVSVRLGGNGISLFKKVTLENVGKEMAVIYRETKFIDKLKNDILVREKVTEEKIISVATIQSALGSQFQITGLSLAEARDLALLLRAGALPATISIVEESVIGPSMGKDNIKMGLFSVAVGLSLVVIFMGIYYSVFGIIANVALLLNLVFLVAIMSLIGATLTLPGIAGIVLTMGMAVDANVLIFERIREELRLGLSPQASIQHGFKHALSTIIDSNLTTLIVGIILFAVGSGPVKGFAVTLSIGIITSLFTAITATKAMVYLLYDLTKSNRVLVGI